MAQDQQDHILSPLNPTTLELIPKKKKLPDNCRKPVGALSKNTKKAMRLCARTGVEPLEALTLVNNGKIPHANTVTKLKNTLEKYRLSHPRLVRLARNVVLDTLRGDTREIDQTTVNRKTGEIVKYQEVISPTITNQLAAAQMVYDRADPTVHQAINVNLNADVSPVDMGKWLNRAKG